MRYVTTVTLIVLLQCVSLFGEIKPKHIADLSPDTTAKYYNPDGSCVQLSIGIAGVLANVPVAARLPFDSEYGPGIRGGSDPDRVANYCNKRHIPAYNVTGVVTIKWIEYGCRTGRYPAVGLGARHFQSVVGWDEETDTFYVCNNQTPRHIDTYTRKEFLRLHHASGEWIVMLKNSAPPNPVIVNWVADLDHN